MVRNAAVEAGNNIGTIKVSVQPESGIRHPKTFIGMLAGNPSSKMSRLGIRFHFEESNYMIAEAMEEYSLASTEASYEDPMEQAPMIFMAERRGFHDGNVSHWWDQKHS